jgi:hypothetical protein
MTSRLDRGIAKRWRFDPFSNGNSPKSVNARCGN